MGGQGFESTTLFWGVVGLSPHLCLGGGGGGGGGVESFLGSGIFFLILFGLGGGGFI